jgi:hypothetical protein
MVAVIAVFQGLKDELGAIGRWTCTALLLPFGLTVGTIVAWGGKQSDEAILTLQSSYL